MVLCMPYTLVLNEPSIIFIPPPDVDLHSDYNDCDDEERAEAEAVVEELTPGHRPFAMQVIIKQAGKRYLSELLVYFAAQREIVKAIETLVVREARGEYVPAMIQIEGEELGGRRYLLTGERKPWPLHDKVRLMWGSRPIECCPEKWKFEFELF